MNIRDALTAMMPEHLLLAGIVALLALSVFGKGRRSTLLLVSVLFLVASAAAAVVLAASGYHASPFLGQFSVAPASLIAKGVLLALAVPVLLMSRTDVEDGELPVLLLSSLYGACLLPSADSFLTLFLGLELMSLPVYALVLLAYHRSSSAEAALKYLVLSGTASATLLMGVALLYGSGGSMSVDSFAAAIGSADTMQRIAVVLILLALFLKGAIVPFHAWAPDAYEGASIAVTAYMATVVKGGVLFAALRLFDGANVTSPLRELLFALPLLSILWGNLAAIRQQSFRRLIAYSSIAHAGYLFYAFLGDAAGRAQAVVFYVVAYSIVNLLAFALLPETGSDQTRDRLQNLRGLYARDPLAAILIAVAMFSLAGIPPLPGFAAKFLIFRSVVDAGYTAYAVIGLVGSYIGIYFYLRVVQLMFMSAASDVSIESLPHEQRVGRLARAAGVVCLAGTILLAVLPGWVMARIG